MTRKSEFSPLVLRRASKEKRETVDVPQAQADPEPAPPQRPAGVSDSANASARLVRELATRLAADACARALRHALAKNPLFIGRFVEDAIAAAGSAVPRAIRLCSADAAALGDSKGGEIQIDDRLTSGDVVVETADGLVEATVDERAFRLVRAAADA